jgi:RND superfamily putative drug exporter
VSRTPTIVTYLFTDPTADLFAQNGAAYRFLGQLEPSDFPVGVARAIPAQIEQGTVIGRKLPLVEATTLLAIALIVGLNFRSVVAPMVTLITAGTGYLLPIGPSADSRVRSGWPLLASSSRSWSP